ncbi:MAG: OadG family protein [Lachnospiraceae bacterium]|nr:OadG family protein [Lachnospiraceae bacterium]
MKIKRKLLAIIVMVLCIGAVSGCAKKVDEGQDAETLSAMSQDAKAFVEKMGTYDTEYINAIVEQYEAEDNSAMADSWLAWLDTKEEVGDFSAVTDTSTEFKDDQYVATVTCTFTKRPMEISIVCDKKGVITNMEFNPVYSRSENMVKAAVHTAIGMGTVFLVLIFISLVIGGFKYINQWEKRSKEKAAHAQAPAAAPPAPAAQPAAVAGAVEEDLTDDLELVAVITAAIAASMGSTSTDGLVVRSIRRKPGAKWKRA